MRYNLGWFYDSVSLTYTPPSGIIAQLSEFQALTRGLLSDYNDIYNAGEAAFTVSVATMLGMKFSYWYSQYINGFMQRDTQVAISYWARATGHDRENAQILLLKEDINTNAPKIMAFAAKIGIGLGASFFGEAPTTTNMQWGTGAAGWTPIEDNKIISTGQLPNLVATPIGVAVVNLNVLNNAGVADPLIVPRTDIAHLNIPGQDSGITPPPATPPGTGNLGKFLVPAAIAAAGLYLYTR